MNDMTWIIMKGGCHRIAYQFIAYMYSDTHRHRHAWHLWHHSKTLWMAFDCGGGGFALYIVTPFIRFAGHLLLWYDIYTITICHVNSSIMFFFYCNNCCVYICVRRHCLFVTVGVTLSICFACFFPEQYGLLLDFSSCMHFSSSLVFYTVSRQS